MVLRGGASAFTDGARKRIAVTCVAVVVMPSVAKGVRTHAWNASWRAPSGMRRFPGERADFPEQLARYLQAFALRAFAVRAAPLAGKAHLGIGEHRGHQRLHALEEHVVARELRRIDREQPLPDARRPPLLREEAVGLEAERGSGQRAREQLHDQ